MKLFGFLASLAIACSSTAAFADEPYFGSSLFICTTVQFEVIVSPLDDGPGLEYRATDRSIDGEQQFVLRTGVRSINALGSILYSFKNGTFQYVVVNSSAVGNEPSQLLVYNNGKQILKQYCKTTEGIES